MSETWGNVTLEAMASGLGIVAYDYAAAREVLRHGENALLAPFGDAAAFIDATLQSRSVRVLPITAQIAVLAQSDAFDHGDPADRLIAATAMAHRATLLSADLRLRKLTAVRVIW